MTQVRYAIYVEALAAFKHIDSNYWLSLEQDTLFLSSRFQRTPSTTAECLKLSPDITVLGKTPLLGFKWQAGPKIRKFQLRFHDDTSYYTFVGEICTFVRILPASTGSSELLHPHAAQESQILPPRQIEDQRDAGSSTPISSHAFEPVLKQGSPRGQKLATINYLTSSSSSSNTVIESYPSVYSSSGQRASQAYDSSQEKDHAGRFSRCATVQCGPNTTLKMPTKAQHRDHDLLRARLATEGASELHNDDMDYAGLTPAELMTRLASFLRDDRNIVLTEKIERLWYDSGMK